MLIEDALYGLICDHARFEQGVATLARDVLDGLLRASTPPVHIFVAAQQSDLLGYAALTYDYSPWRAHRWAHLDCLFVRDECRGLSIGRELFDSALSHARDGGADRLE